MLKMKKALAVLCVIFSNIFAVTFCFPDVSYPQRIISLGPAITEELYLLGVEDRIVGTTVYCNKPSPAQNKEKVGTVIKFNLEKIVHLQADCVLATSLADPQDVGKLRDLGIKVVCFPPAQDFSQICEQFLELGRVVGEEREAKRIIHQAKTRVGQIRKEIEDLPGQKVFVQTGARPIFTINQDSFINDFIEFAGGINVASASGSGFYSREKVLQDNPDVIIITTMGIVGEEEREIWERFSALKAVQDNRIYIVDSDSFCSPTPVSFVQTLEEMVELLH